MKNFTKLTEKEARLVSGWLAVAKGNCGAETIADLIEDNFSWATVKDLVNQTGLEKMQVVGLISSLEQKGIVEVEYGDKYTPDMWYITYEYLGSLEPSTRISYFM